MLQQAEKTIFARSLRSANNPFDTMFAEERARLIRLCAHLVGNVDVAEDLAQETLLEAWRNWQKIGEQQDREYRARWLSAIANNVCKRWTRKHYRDLTHLTPFKYSTDEEEMDIEDVSTDEDGVEIELERDELARLLDRALALLPQATRDVLIERYLHESSHAEIVERLGLSEDALVQRLYRGRLALRRVITKYMEEEAASYGIVVPEEEKLQEETHIWCPICSKGRLIKYYNPTRDGLGFTCPKCWHIAFLQRQYFCNEVKSPKSLLARQVAWLGNYYWQAINEGRVSCLGCGQAASIEVVRLQDILPQHRLTEPSFAAQGQGYPGIYITCRACHYEDSNILPHLTLDLPEAQQFWRKHPRMRWQPGLEIEHESQPALISSFQSATDAAQLDVVYRRDTLQVLSIYHSSR